MRLQSLFPVLVALAWRRRLGESVRRPTEPLPQLLATRQTVFSIPFRVAASSDPAWQPSRRCSMFRTIVARTGGCTQGAGGGATLHLSCRRRRRILVRHLHGRP